MAKNYYEVRVDGSHIKYEKAEVNGHTFELFLERLSGSNEWYAGLVGVLPEYLESEHKKPMLIGRGPSEDECRKVSLEFLGETFPVWDDKKRKAYETARAEEAAAQAKVDAAKKDAAREAKKAAS